MRLNLFNNVPVVIWICTKYSITTTQDFKKVSYVSQSLGFRIDWLMQPIYKKIQIYYLFRCWSERRIPQDSVCWTDDFQFKSLPFYIKNGLFIWIVSEQQGRVCLRQYPLTFRVSWFQVQDFRAFKCQSKDRGSQPSLIFTLAHSFFMWPML